MSMAKWTARLRRRRALAFRRRSIPERCPLCGAVLEETRESFLVQDRRGEKALISGDARFCSGCDVVVLDADGLRELARLGVPDSKHLEVMGFVDLDAVPDDKSDAPLGEDDNPVPVVPFEHFEWVGRAGPTIRHAVRRRWPSLNAKCPCGSGKKYKRCCGRDRS